MSHLTLVVSQDVVEHVSVPAPGLVVITDGPQLPSAREELRLAWQGVARAGHAPRRLWSRLSRKGRPLAVPTVLVTEPVRLTLVG